MSVVVGKTWRVVDSRQQEALRFKLGTGAWYKPDFAVWLPGGRLRLVEIKGYRRCEWWMLRREKNQWVRML